MKREVWDRWAVAGLMAWLGLTALATWAGWQDQGLSGALEELAVLLGLWLVGIGQLWLVRRVWPGVADRSLGAAAAAWVRAYAKGMRWALVALGALVGLAAGPAGWLALAVLWRRRGQAREIQELRAAREALERERARLAGTADGGEVR